MYKTAKYVINIIGIIFLESFSSPLSRFAIFLHLFVYIYYEKCYPNKFELYRRLNC